MPARESPRASKSEQAYVALKKRIANGTYSAGHRLVLDQLAKELAVSAVPVREALRRLEAEGYVRFMRNIGAEVIGIDDVAFKESMEALAYLEGIATSLAAPAIDEPDLARATELNEQMAASMSAFDPVGFTHLNQEFHELLCARCPNGHLRTLVHREWERLSIIRRSVFTFVPGRAQESVREHQHILELIAEHQPQRDIELAVRAHKMGTWAAYTEYRRQQGRAEESA